MVVRCCVFSLELFREMIDFGRYFMDIAAVGAAILAKKRIKGGGCFKEETVIEVDTRLNGGEMYCVDVQKKWRKSCFDWLALFFWFSH